MFIFLRIGASTECCLLTDSLSFCSLDKGGAGSPVQKMVPSLHKILSKLLDPGAQALFP